MKIYFVNFSKIAQAKLIATTVPTRLNLSDILYELVADYIQRRKIARSN